MDEKTKTISKIVPKDKKEIIEDMPDHMKDPLNKLKDKDDVVSSKKNQSK